MVTPEICEFPAQAPHLESSHRGKQQFYCNSFWLTGNILPILVPRGIGYEFGESKWWHVSFPSLKHHPQPNSGEPHCVTPALACICWLSCYFRCHKFSLLTQLDGLLQISAPPSGRKNLLLLGPSPLQASPELPACSVASMNLLNFLPFASPHLSPVAHL